MFCEHCGKKQEGTWTFCKGCGRKIVKESDGSSDDQMTSLVHAELSQTLAATTIDDEENTDIGSDWYEDEPISEAEIAEYEKLMNECGYNALIQKLDEANSEWKKSTINIAITGEAGTGKSTLINSLRGLKADDRGAALTGCTETTTEVTCYPHPQNPNLRIWDLPGVGTPNFTRDKFCETVDFQDYDFLLLVSSSRFKGNDMWLANKIMECRPNTNLMFIRTKIDNDLENFRQERRKPLNPGETTMMLRKIKKECIDHLGQTGIKDPKVFLINSHKTGMFDFNKFNMMLIETVSDLKRDAMILSLTTHSDEILEKKIVVLRKQIPKTSKVAAVQAAFSNRGDAERMELKILMDGARLYAKQLGISSESLALVAKYFKKDVSELKQNIHMETPALLASEKSFLQYYKRYDKFQENFVHTIPVIGFQEKVRKIQKQCTAVLKNMLELCKSESKKLQTQIALWSHTDTEEKKDK